MKKKHTAYISTILLTLLLASCDPGYNVDYVFENKTAHSLQIMTFADTSTNASVKKFVLQDSIIALPNSTTSKHYEGGIGSCSADDTPFPFQQADSISAKVINNLSILFIGDIKLKTNWVGNVVEKRAAYTDCERRMILTNNLFQ